MVGRSIFSNFQLIRDMLDMIDKTFLGRLFAGGLVCSIRMSFLVLFATEVCQCRFFLTKTFAQGRAIFLSVRKTMNIQGHSELREPIKTRENCYPLIW